MSEEKRRVVPELDRAVDDILEKFIPAILRSGLKPEELNERMNWGNDCPETDRLRNLMEDLDGDDSKKAEELGWLKKSGG